MPLPFDYVTRALVGIELRDALVHLNRDVGAFSDYWDRTGGGRFGLLQGTAAYQWESLDSTRAYGVDASNLRFEHRSLLPAAVERELGTPTSLPPARDLDALLDAVRRDVAEHARGACEAVHAGPVRRLGLVLEMEVESAVVAAILSPFAAAVPGGSGVTEAIGRVVVSLGAQAGAERRVILTVGQAPGTGQRVSRFLPVGPDILVLSFDYQEILHEPVPLLPRAARRANGVPDLSQLVADAMTRALEVARGVAR